MSRLQGRKRWVTIAVVALAALILAPAAVWASHTFNDVPDDNTFHEDIEAIADARVTIGCNPPANTDYCPDDFVTREQMAAFMNRLGALANDKEPVVNARAVQGLGLYSDSMDLSLAGGEARECEPAGSLLDDPDYGTFFVSVQLGSVPDGAATVDVNVATSGEDLDGTPAATGYFVCFSSNDGTTPLPGGTYTVMRMEAHDIGSVSG
jgi:hypothetical protein